MQRHAACGSRLVGDLGDTCQQATSGTELGDRGELLDRRGEAHLQLAEGARNVESTSGEGAQRGDHAGEREAEFLGVGRTGVVEARAVDRRHAHVGMLIGEGAGLLRQRPQVGVQPRRIPVVGPDAERVGAERTANDGPVDALSLPEAPQPPSGCEPLAAGVENDGCDVEVNPVEYTLE